MDWERNIDQIFEFKELDDDKCYKNAVLKLSGGASLWYEGLKNKRTREGKEKFHNTCYKRTSNPTFLMHLVIIIHMSTFFMFPFIIHKASFFTHSTH